MLLPLKFNTMILYHWGKLFSGAKASKQLMLRSISTATSVKYSLANVTVAPTLIHKIARQIQRIKPCDRTSELDQWLLLRPSIQNIGLVWMGRVRKESLN